MTTINTTFSYDNIVYKITSVTPLTVDVYDNSNTLLTDIIIPTIVTSPSPNNIQYNVKRIFVSAFLRNNIIKSITIPSSVTEIMSASFYECINLTSLTLSEGLLNIGTSSFTSCISVNTNLIIPSSVISIGNSAFSNCNKIPSLTLSDGLQTIASSAFNKLSITNLIIPSSVNSIGSQAFHQCNNLTSITYNHLNVIPTLSTISQYPFFRNILTNLRTYYVNNISIKNTLTPYIDVNSIIVIQNETLVPNSLETIITINNPTTYYLVVSTNNSNVVSNLNFQAIRIG